MRRLLSIVSILLWVLDSLLSPVHLRADTVSFPAVADAGIWEVSPTNNSGLETSIRVGNVGAMSGGLRARGLFRFDLAEKTPAGSTITSARLSLAASKTTDGQPRSFELRRMLVPWTEGESSWNVRFAPDVPWSEPGGAEGRDYSEIASATTTVVDGETNSWGSTTGLVADVQQWLDEPAGNHGWMLRRDEETTANTARRFNTRESSSGEPTLTVEFTPPFHISLVEIVNDQFYLRFTALAGQTYVVERRGLVAGGVWSVVTNLPPTPVGGPVTVCDPIASGNRFYRIGRR